MAHRVDNPANPWLSEHVEYLGEPPAAPLEVYEEDASSILSRNDSPDVPFSWSINPYRGCFHGCAYCYARPTHQYLDWGAGSDFERRIVVKRNAAELLAHALSRSRIRRDGIAFSGVTDCYQPLEATYGLTRRCLEQCLRYQQRVDIITKGALVERDRELLAELEQRAGCEATISIPFVDDAMARAIEPFAATASRRFETLTRLRDAGVPTAVALAPVIPGLNDDQIPAILRRAREAGAARAFLVLLRLPGPVAEIFEQRLAQALPLRHPRVMRTLAAMRPDGPRAHAFGQRMRGQGPRWQVIEQLFAVECRRLGLAIRKCATEESRRAQPRQGRLF